MTKILTRGVVSQRGGAGEPAWRPLAVTFGALVDPEGIVSALTVDPTTGRLTVTYGAHTAGIRDGLQEAVARRHYPLLSLVPDYDPDTDILEFGFDCDGFVHGTVEAGIFLGIVDSTTVDGSLAGTAMALRQATLAGDLVGRMSVTSSPNTIGSILLDGLQCSIGVGSNGTNYPSVCVIRGKIEGTERWQQILGSQADVLRAPTSNWQVIVGAWHGSTDDPNGTVQIADLVWRLRRTSRPFP